MDSLLTEDIHSYLKKHQHKLLPLFLAALTLSITVSFAQTTTPMPPPTSSASTQPIVTEARRTAVLEALHAYNRRGQDTGNLSDMLVELGKDFLPALRDAIDHPETLTTDDEIKSNRVVALGGDAMYRQFQKSLTTFRVSSLRLAITRLELGFDPRDAICDFLAQKSNQPKWTAGKPTGLPDPILEKCFPDFVVYYQIVNQFPANLAHKPQPPLEIHNLFFVGRKDKSVTHITNADDLKSFVATHLPRVTDEAAAKVAIHAWLVMSQVLSNDGRFRFDIPESSLEAEAKTNLVATGRADVDESTGNHGRIVATLTFDTSGKLVDAHEDVDLKAGTGVIFIPVGTRPQK